MIIDWKTDSLHYAKKIRQAGSLHYRCPSCKKKRTLVRHGFYKRNVVQWLGRTVEQELCLLRVRCKSCSHTHAVLPKDVIPYRIYCVSFYWKLIRILSRFRNQVSLCSLILNTYFNLIYRVCARIHFMNSRYRKISYQWLLWFYPEGVLSRKKLRQYIRYTT